MSEVNIPLRMALRELTRMADLTGWAYFDDGMRMLRTGRGPLRLTDGREVTPGELRVGDVMRSSDGQRTWVHRVIRVETDTRVLDTTLDYKEFPLPVDVEGPRPSRWEILAGD